MHEENFGLTKNIVKKIVETETLYNIDLILSLDLITRLDYHKLAAQMLEQNKHICEIVPASFNIEDPKDQKQLLKGKFKWECREAKCKHRTAWFTEIEAKAINNILRSLTNININIGNERTK